MNPMDVRRGMLMAVEKVEDYLRKISVKLKTKEELANVATISANNDSTIGNLIASIMERVGTEGTINVQDGKTLEHEVEYVEGLKFDRGYISPYFVTDHKTQKCEFENPLILILDQKVSDIQSAVKYLEYAAKAHRPLLIIAEDVESEALATLIINKLRGGLRVCAVKSPGFGDNRKSLLSDMCIATQATMISDEIGVTLDAGEPESNLYLTQGTLGSCKKVIITKDDTIIIEGSGSK